MNNLHLAGSREEKSSSFIEMVNSTDRIIYFLHPVPNLETLFALALTLGFKVSHQVYLNYLAWDLLGYIAVYSPKLSQIFQQSLNMITVGEKKFRADAIPPLRKENGACYRNMNDAFEDLHYNFTVELQDQLSLHGSRKVKKTNSFFWPEIIMLYTVQKMLNSASSEDIDTLRSHVSDYYNIHVKEINKILSDFFQAEQPKETIFGLQLALQKCGFDLDEHVRGFSIQIIGQLDISNIHRMASA